MLDSRHGYTLVHTPLSLTLKCQEVTVPIVSKYRRDRVDRPDRIVVLPPRP
jgi:hypothetical protein